MNMTMDTIRKMRIRKGVTQRQVAERMGIKREYYVRMEAGGCSPSIDKVEQAASALDCTLEVVEHKSLIMGER